MLEKNLQHFDEQSPHNVEAGKCIMMMMENNFTLKTGVSVRGVEKPEWSEPVNPFENYNDIVHEL